MPLFEFQRYQPEHAFQPLSGERLFDHLSEHLLEHGEHLLRYLQRLPEEDRSLVEQLIREGYLDKDERGRLLVTLKGQRRIAQKALQELFNAPQRDAPGRHETAWRGSGEIQPEETRPYQFGDPLSLVEPHQTLRNALRRQAQNFPGATGHRGIHLAEEDFVVYETWHASRCATVMLLDMSGSMGRYGKFLQAKRVALALRELIRQQYPEDYLEIIGFYTFTTPLSDRALLLATPKEVSIFDSRVYLRISLDHPPRHVPEHFTNIHAALRVARERLRRTGCANRQILCITDGEPTAHLEGREVVLIYPPSEKTARLTIEEAVRCHLEGIHISTVALVDDPFYFGLTRFVQRLAAACRGTAVYCSVDNLATGVLESFRAGRRIRRTWGR
ncbi:MAG: VWA domain-containing protein [Gemmatales bacterium]|nr:VWA domain-containing protein [Gemmatales bacterium]MDW7994870.1 VWA domain-containing protein [Gemmatales bacterium]